MSGRGYRRWVLAKGALAALYAAYVSAAIGAPPLVAVVLGLGLAATVGALAYAGPPRDPDRVRAASAVATLVLAALHARALPLTAPFEALHLGLAGAIAASSFVTLTLHRSAGHPLATLALCLAPSLLVVVARGPSLTSLAIAIAAAVFAWLRPLGALGAAFGATQLHQGPVDPGLFWDAVPVPACAKEVVRPCP